jgi:hypothetical protein
VVRHQVLVLAFGGSSPSSPAIIFTKNLFYGIIYIMLNDTVFELTGREIINGFSPSILVSADVLATDLWHTMVSDTQLDYRERGVVVGRPAGKNVLVRSEIIEGYGQESGEGLVEVVEASLPVPMFPFGILRGMSQRLKKDVVIHTHPMPPEVDHVRTSIISDKDIRCFVGSKYTGMVMLDRGGAHLMVRTGPSNQYDCVPGFNLVSSTMSEVINKGGGSMDVMTRFARQIGRYGLGYYYTPDLKQSGETVEFQNLKVAKYIQ